ncbi:MAG: hypothetical protein PWP27_130 [Clostridiales bacterium]|nr:hypothetical protein [Clostridiales bacterium]
MLPDVLGYKMEKGRNILANNGYNDIKIIFTKSPYKTKISPSSQDARIIRVRKVSESTVELLICYV